MKTMVVTVALAWLALPSFGAVEYEFVQKTSSDDSSKPASDLTARAIVDGGRTRVDFIGGNAYPPGTYVVSTEGAHKLVFVDPAKQWYTEFNAAHAASTLGAANIRIANLKSEVRRLDDSQTIAGIETDHYRLTLTYEITLTMRNIPLRQRVQTDIDRWVTSRFASADAFGTSTLRTGNPDVDALMEAESGRIPGFAMRQTVTTRATFDPPKRRTELKIQPQRTVLREMWVTRIREVAPDASLFIVPASYRRADQPEQKAASQLTFEPKAN
jgi:hypothetical protein